MNRTAVARELVFIAKLLARREKAGKEDLPIDEEKEAGIIPISSLKSRRAKRG